MLKKIAVIVSGIDEEYQSTILAGLRDSARKHGAKLVHFVAFGGVLHNENHDIGEYNIYKLCNYAEFDGVVLLTNTIADVSVTASIVEEIQKFDIPVVCVDNDLDVKFHHVGIDNFKAMEQMVRHVTEFHKCRKIGYISGPETNPESIMRFNAFEQVMREHGIALTEDMIYYGSFRSCDGREGAEYFLKNENGLPEAIICANDAMALATVLTLEECGIRVPEDVIVTGFDNIYAARNFDPAISSVKRPLYQSGYLAGEKLLNADTKEMPRSVILETESVFRCSCGCEVAERGSEEERDSNRSFRKTNYRILDFYQVNIPMVNRMSCNLAESNNFSHNLDILKPFIQKIDCDRFYLCLNENWNEIRQDREVGGQKLKLVDTYVTGGYTERMIVPLAYVNGEFTSLPAFSSEKMLPDCEAEFDETMMYYMLPLHFRDRCFGYCVICNDELDMENPLLHSWVMNIANSLESVRKTEYLDRAMYELDQLYVMDPLCKINNRNGFNKFSADIFDECRRLNKQVMMMFIDMDGLKMINDTYSHEEGDNGLKQLARAIKLSCRSGEIYARFGGDEFIIFGPDFDEAHAQDLANRIQAWMDEYNSTSGKPYPVAASIGWYICQVDADSSLYPLITAADKKMYEEKKRKRVSRYLRH